jgi:hypothetical protein
MVRKIQAVVYGLFRKFLKFVVEVYLGRARSDVNSHRDRLRGFGWTGPPGIGQQLAMAASERRVLDNLV